MVLSILPSFIILDMFSPFSLEEFGIDLSRGIEVSIYLSDVVYFLALSAVIVFFHELIHLVSVPGFLSSDKTFLGFSFFGGFAYSEEIMSKSRFGLIFIAPYVVISIILPVILGALNLLSPLTKFIILSNAMGSGVDILGLILILSQVPSGASVTCNGIKTYWKRIDNNRHQ